jgi:hypothetical protein
MVVRGLVAGVALFMVMAAGAGVRAAPMDTCSLGGRYPIRSVVSYTTVENEGYTTYRNFRGAEIVVPAQPGLTAEWLQRVLSNQIATGACDFGVQRMNVDVMSAGDGFSVRLSGSDERAAGVILKHAQLLMK